MFLILYPLFFSEFITNSKGKKLFTCRWIPTNFEPKALVFLNHGYAMECSVSMKGAAMRLVKAGFGVYGIDNQGHGKSDGIKGFISHFNDLVENCSQFFTSICERNENKNKLRILLGESMGGAMVLRLHLKKPDFWDGGVFGAPMCKVFTSVFRSRPDWPIGQGIGTLAGPV
ncbi:putative 2-acylglycerol O-acyltransferase [Helianthus annuus]|nr:putative 2-acylglycerol O-acyltransferase [Helianthus annuus]